VLRLLDRQLLGRGGITIDPVVASGEITLHEAVIPGGIGDLPGPTAVDIRVYYKSTRLVEEGRLEAIITGTGERFRSLLLIIITAFELKAEELRSLRQRAEAAAAKEPFPLNVGVWTNSEIESILREYPDAVSDLLPQVAQAGVNRLVDRAATAEDGDQWEERRSRLIDRAAQAFHDRGVFLFLGAGCSADAGIPAWNMLIHKLLLRLIEKKVSVPTEVSDSARSDLARTLGLVESSPLLAARYTRAGLGEEFEPAVRSLLYDGLDQDRVERAALLRVLAKLCVPRAAGVRGVVTYNFDDLLEYHLDDIGVPFQSIWTDRGTVSESELPIFHVHGFLPRGTISEDESDPGLLVFSEEGYHRLLNDPYFWANVVQLNYLRERTCIFVGLSLTDPNLRRILEVVTPATIKLARHYILLQRLSNQRFADLANKNGMKIDLAHGARVLQVHHELQQDSLLKLGLNIIWYEEHEEVPRILEAIRKNDARPGRDGPGNRSSAEVKTKLKKTRSTGQSAK
jgi:hypothetical protein